MRVYQDVWAALHHDPVPTSQSTEETDEVMRFAGNYVVPGWLAGVYLGSNIVLNTLNFYWFGKMIETIKKRFTEVKGKGKRKEEKVEGVLVEGLIDTSTIVLPEVVDESEVVPTETPEVTGEIKMGRVDGRTVEVESTQVRRRKD